MNNPKAGQKGLKIREVGGEVVIFDPKNEVAHRVSRRDFMRKAGIAASAALAIPILESMSVPAHAAEGRCFGNHNATVLGTGTTKAQASAAAREAAIAKAEAVCRSFECDDGECVSNGHPYFPVATPTCRKIKDDSWQCGIGFKAVCRCVGGQ